MKTDWDELIEDAKRDEQDLAHNPIFRWATNVYRGIALTGDPDAPCGICGRTDFHCHYDEEPCRVCGKPNDHWHFVDMP